MDYEKMLLPASEAMGRIARLQERLAGADLDGALIVDNLNRYYFSGTLQQGHLYIPAEGEALLMTKGLSPRAQEESPLQRIVPIKSLREIPELIRGQGTVAAKKIGVEMDALPANLYFRYKKLLSDYEITDVSPMISLVRAVKSPFEIELIKKAAGLSDLIFETARENLAEGIMEVELFGYCFAAAAKAGHPGVVRVTGFNQETYPIFIAGSEALVPGFMDAPVGGRGVCPAFGQGAGWKRIQRNEPVLVDYCGVFGGYIADQTRTLVIGELPDILRRAYATARAVLRKIEQEARPGILCGEVYGMALSVVERLGFGDAFMGLKGKQVPYIGHGVGLYLNELPVLAKNNAATLEEGMVLAVEPKFFFDGLGVVGLENTYVVRAKGLEALTYSDEDLL